MRLSSGPSIKANGDLECRNSAQCAPAKHHFDECVERVQKQESEGEAQEDCVEECTLRFPPGSILPRY